MRFEASGIELELQRWGVPERMWGGLTRYLVHHIRPGSFWEAVLSDSLVDAFGCADEENALLMRNYALFMYNWMPGRGTCWGSQAVVERWIEEGKSTEGSEDGSRPDNG